VEVALWPALQLLVKRYNNGMAAWKTGKGKDVNHPARTGRPTKAGVY